MSSVTGNSELQRLASVCKAPKTKNQFGREDVRFQHATGDPILCPVRAARWIRKGARSFDTRTEDPAMQLQAGSGISSHMVAKEANLDPRRFSTHSVRNGGATKLLNTGADRLVIKLLGRWMSSCFEDYPVLAVEWTAGLSSMMCLWSGLFCICGVSTPLPRQRGKYNRFRHSEHFNGNQWKVTCISYHRKCTHKCAKQREKKRLLSALSLSGRGKKRWWILCHHRTRC